MTPLIVSNVPANRFSASNLHEHQDIPGYSELIQKLTDADKGRSAFLKACLVKLGLEVSTEELPVPSLSPLHFSAIKHELVSETLSDWESIITRDAAGEELIKADMDMFHIQKRDSRWDVALLKKALEPSKDTKKSEETSFVDYSMILKTIIPYETEWPGNKETPCFHHNVYYSHLQRYRLLEKDANDWGSLLVYGEVLTSTNSILDKCVSLCLLFVNASANPANLGILSCSLSSLQASLWLLRHRLLAVVVGQMSGCRLLDA